MAIEIEAKMRVEDFATVHAALRGAGAHRIGEVIEENIFFDTAEKALLSARSGLRLRINRHVPSGEETFVLTFKGPAAASQLKMREEIEIVVDSAQQTIVLLSRLGYEREISFEKRRESWSLADCKIELDELPRVGRFVEIEGPDEAAVMQMRSRLELSDHPLIKEPYISMVAAIR